jgi:hypothetical protein
MSFFPDARWFTGPEFLKKSEDQWPQKVSLPTQEGEVEELLTTCK